MTSILDPSQRLDRGERQALDAVVLAGSRRRPDPVSFVVDHADGAAELAAVARLRHAAFVREQALFARSDRDDVDDDPRAETLVARAPDGTVLGGVRLAPAVAERDIGWWRGSRLVVDPAARRLPGVADALVRAACARAESRGALRFDALVQARHLRLFTALGWVQIGAADLHGRPHVHLDWPIARVRALVAATKSTLGGLTSSLVDVAPGFVGDDGAPVPGSDLVAACDAIVPSMVERDPEWAGWCSVLVNVNDLTAMGATPVGLLDAVGARDASFARRVLRGLADAAQAWGVPVLGGHTQLGVPAALSVTALGRTPRPVPGGGGRAGQDLRVTADLAGGWRPGHTGRQWDSTTGRTAEDLRRLTRVVADLAPGAAKDVSMCGLVGTTGMLAEASGVRAVLEPAAIPTPRGADPGDWLTCFPGFAMVTAHPAGGSPAPSGLPTAVESAVCGRLEAGSGVALRWPDGVLTEALGASVTGLGAA